MDRLGDMVVNESPTWSGIHGPNIESLFSKPGDGMETMKKYQIFFIILDICCNLVVDCVGKEVILILVTFGLQFISLIINLVMYAMGTANLAMRLGLRRGTLHHHEANVTAILLYLILTIWWYILALRKTWSGVSEHFSFTFVDNSSEIHPLGLSIVHTAVVVASGMINQTSDGIIDGKNTTSMSSVDFHQLWSPSFITLYTIHRTVAVLYYIIYMQTIFILLNGPLLSRLGYYNKDEINEFGFGDFDFKNHVSVETVSSVVNENEHGGMDSSGNGMEYKRQMKSSRISEPAFNFDSSDSTPIKVIALPEKKMNQNSHTRKTRKSSEDFSSVELY